LTNLDAFAASPIDQLIDEWATMIPTLDPRSFSIQLKVYQVNLLASRIYNRLAQKFDVTNVDVDLLMVIRRDQGRKPVRPSDLWRQLELRPSAITYRIDRLFEQGLVDRTPDPSDRRALFLTLTSKGEALVAAVVGEFNAITADRMKAVKDAGGDPEAFDKLLALYLDAWNNAPSE